MKKIRISHIIVFILVLVAVFLMSRNRSGTMNKAENRFAVEDTTTITRLFFADKQNNTSDLKRTADGGWSLNDTYFASRESVNLMLRTLVNLEVKLPVAKAARNTIFRLMSSKSVKVEVYQRVYRIDLFGKIRLFPHEKRTRTFFVGDHTQDNMGTYMLMEGADNAYVVSIPGLRGFVSSRFTAKEYDWRDHTIFDIKLPEIRMVSMSYSDSPAMSFSITNRDSRSFELKSLETNLPVSDYDTLKVIEYLGSFRRINFENLVNGLAQTRMDSIIAQPPVFVLSLEDKLGKQTTLKAWRRKARVGDVDLEGKQREWDMDRMYAQLEGSKELFVIQYFVFDRLLKPLPWFTEKLQQASPTL